MAQITYADKITMNSNSSIPATNKCQASDMNMIKSVVNDNYTELTNTINDMNTYSKTSEKIVGVWVDGKPIYRKTFYVASLPNNNYTSIAHNIANIDEIVNIYGTMRSSNYTTVAFNMVGQAALYGEGSILTVRADRTNITIGTTKDWRNNVAFITLEYTKTTD